MVEPDFCKHCGSTNFIFVPNNIVFNPDLEIDEIMDSYVCVECKTIHVETADFSFFDISIDINKEYTNNNMHKWMN